MDNVKAKIDELEHIVKLQMQKLEELAAENGRLAAAYDAHGVLKSIYLDPDAPQGNRIKAASAALPVEKPKLMSVVPSSQPSRIERWKAYERFRLRREILTETRRLPAPGSGWDAHLVDGTYQPPEGDAEPPLDLYGKDSIKAHCIMSSLMQSTRRNSNGGDDSGAGD